VACFAFIKQKKIILSGVSCIDSQFQTGHDIVSTMSISISVSMTYKSAFFGSVLLLGFYVS